MYNLIRFCNQNRKKIIKIILIIVFAISIIQLLNYLSKNDNKNNINNIETERVSYGNEVISNKSAISGSSVSDKKLKRDSDLINEFFQYCKDGNIELAYNLLTDDCKDEMYSTIEDFKNIYYNYLFNGEKKSYTIENWIKDVYRVRVTNDILSTGKLDSTETRQDYVTIVEENGEYKLNINSYVGRKKTNKVTEYNGIKFTITQIDTYMDYIIYNLYVENNTDNTIMLNMSDDVKSIYLVDSNDNKSYSFNNELDKERLIIKSKFKNNIKLRFNNSYNSTRKIKNIVFSKFLMNYDEYSNLEEKSQYGGFSKIIINV